MKTIAKIFSIILIISNFSFAQLVQITEPNMYSDVPIYKNSEGTQYSTLIVFTFNTKLIDLPKGTALFNKNNITNSSFNGLVNRLKNHFGDFSILKIVPDAIWGDTLRKNKRTKQIVKVPDLSQIYKIEFENPIPTGSVCEIIKSYPNIKSVDGPIIS